MPPQSREELGNCRHKSVPGSSLYLQPLRMCNEFAGRFTELPITARFICIYQVVSYYNNSEEMHI